MQRLPEPSPADLLLKRDGSRQPFLSVVIVLYNSAAELAGCLESIRQAIESGSAEAIIVDNDSPDDSATVARRELDTHGC